MKILGITLLIAGIIMTAFTGFDIITKEKVADVGSVEINKKEKTPVYWTPITGGVIAIAGLVLIVSARRKRSG